jgi:hypothetical protein
MDLEQQLRTALAPCKPGPALRANVIARVSAGVRPVRGRASIRLVLVGTVLAVAAAALMLATSLTRSPAPSAIATAPVPAPSPPSVPQFVEPVVATSPAPATASPASVQVEPKEAVSPVKPFTVSVLPIENASTEAAVTSAVDTFHRALLDGLRATPGLILLTPESEEAAAGTPADYRLTMKGTGSTQTNTFTIALKAGKVGSYVQPYQIVGSIVGEYQISGRIPPECGANPGCGDAIGMAARQLQLLRETVFPESPVRAQEMRARLLDPVLGARERLDALLALESLRGDGVLSPAQLQSAEGRAALRDPAVVRGAIALATAASEDFVRAQVWKKMRGVGSAELVQPLIAAARTDGSRNVRVEAVMTLAADFASEPRARDALETVAQQDSQPVVRVLAQSGLAGKDAWPRHLVASLKDTNLSDLERIEALYYAMNQHQAKPALREVLADEESIRAFVQVLPGAVRSAAASPADMAKANALTTVLVSRLESIDHPAVTDMLLDAWEHPWVPDQFLFLNQLARRAADPRVRALLEEVSTGTADPPLREIARNALNKLAMPPAR